MFKPSPLKQQDFKSTLEIDAKDLEKKVDDPSTPDVWEGEVGTDKHKAWIKKKNEQSDKMRDKQKRENQTSGPIKEESETENEGEGSFITRLFKETQLKIQKERDKEKEKEKEKTKEEETTPIALDVPIGQENLNKVLSNNVPEIPNSDIVGYNTPINIPKKKGGTVPFTNIPLESIPFHSGESDMSYEEKVKWILDPANKIQETYITEIEEYAKDNKMSFNDATVEYALKANQESVLQSVFNPLINLLDGAADLKKSIGSEGKTIVKELLDNPKQTVTKIIDGVGKGVKNLPQEAVEVALKTQNKVVEITGEIIKPLVHLEAHNYNSRTNKYLEIHGENVVDSLEEKIGNRDLGDFKVTESNGIFLLESTNKFVRDDSKDLSGQHFLRMNLTYINDKGERVPVPEEFYEDTMKLPPYKRHGGGHLSKAFDKTIEVSWEFLTPEEVQNQNPDFFGNTNVKLEEEYYSNGTDLSYFDKFTPYDQDEKYEETAVVEYLNKRLKKYNIKASETSLNPRNSITLTSEDGTTKEISLSADYLKTKGGDLLQQAMSVKIVDNSAGKIKNKIENFVKSHGTKFDGHKQISSVSDKENRDLLKEVNLTHLAPDENGNVVGIDYVNLKKVEDQAVIATSLVEEYNNIEIDEEKLKEKLKEYEGKGYGKDQIEDIKKELIKKELDKLQDEFLVSNGYSSTKVNARDFIIRNNYTAKRYPGDEYTGINEYPEEFANTYGENDRLSALEIASNPNFNYGLSNEEASKINILFVDDKGDPYVKRSAEYKELYDNIDIAMDFLKDGTASKNILWEEYYDIKEKIDIEHPEVVAYLANYFAKNPKELNKYLSGNNNLVTIAMKEALINKARNSVIKKEVARNTVRKDEFNKVNTSLDQQSVELEGEMEGLREQSKVFTDQLLPLAEELDDLESKIEPLTEEINSLIGDLNGFGEITSQDDVDVYNRLLQDLRDKESKQKTLITAADEKRNAYNSIIESDDFIQLISREVEFNQKFKGIQDKREINNEKGQELSEDYTRLFSQLGINSKTMEFEDNFKATAAYRDFQESNSDNSTMDAMASFTEETYDQASKFFIGTGTSLVSGVYSLFEGNDEDAYYFSEQMNDYVYNWIEEDMFAPTSERKGGIAEGGFTYKNTTKTIAEMLPFTIGIIAAASRGKPMTFQGSMKTFNNKAITKSVADALRVDRNVFAAGFGMTFYDNQKEGEAAGLSGPELLMYTTFMSTVTGVSGLIMQDQKYFSTVAGKKFKDLLIGKLSTAQTTEGMKAVLNSAWKNIAKELGEEEFELVMQDLVKISHGLAHTTMSQELQTHQDLIAGTIMLSGTLQTAGSLKRYNAVKRMVEQELQGRTEEVLQGIQVQLETNEDKLQRYKDLKNPPKGKIQELQRRIDELKKSKVYVRAQEHAQKNSPSDASGESIELLTEKNVLIEEKQNAKDKSETVKIDERIKEIDNQLEGTKAHDNYISDQKKDVESTKNKVKKQYEANQEEIKKVDEQIKELENSVRKGQAGEEVDDDFDLQEVADKIESLQDKREKLDQTTTVLEAKTSEEAAEIIELNLNEQIVIKNEEIREAIKASTRGDEGAEARKNKLFAERKALTNSLNNIGDVQQEVLTNNEINNINYQISKLDPDKDQKTIKELTDKRNGLENTINNSLGFDGFMSNGFITLPDINGDRTIVINKEQSLRSGYITTGQHEYLHAILNDAVGSDPELQAGLGASMVGFINDNPSLIKGNGKFNQRLRAYGGIQTYVETMPLLSEALSRKDIVVSDGFLGSMKDTYRQWMQRSGRADITFNTGEDVFNFIKDYNQTIKSGKENKAFTKASQEGISGDLVNRATERTIGPQFSKSIKNTFASHPDMKNNFDKHTMVDGGKKWDSKEEFQESMDYWEGYMEIENSKGLESLIKQGVAGETGISTSQEMDDFVSKTKENLLKRYKANYDPSMANGSLFGWLVGGSGNFTQSTLYRAKGDVMNEYKREIQLASLDEETKRIVQIEDEADVSLEVFENQDLTKEKAKKVKGVKLHEKLGPKANNINNEVKNAAAGINISNLDFKTLKDLTPELTQELFGIVPKVGNLTKQDIKNAQMFINKNADILKAMLPKGSTASGTSTGVQKVLLDAFYTKSDRTKAAKTGSTAGLAVQIKNPNISTKEFLDVFGITERGKENTYKKDSNTSARIKALVAQTGKMITNQGVREHLIERQESLNTIQKISDGKSGIMFSTQEKQTKRNLDLELTNIDNFKDTYIYNLGALGDAIHGRNVRVPTKPIEIYKSDGTIEIYNARDLDAIYNKETKETFGDAGARVINTFLEGAPEFREVIKKTMTGGRKGGFFLTVGNFNSKINKTTAKQLNLGKYDYNKGKLFLPSVHEKIGTAEFKQDQKQRLPALLNFFKAVEGHLQNFPSDVWMFEEMLLDTGKQQNTVTRILAPLAFYPVDPKTKKAIFNKKVVEEHTDPQNQIGKSLLAGALFSNVDEVWKVVGKSYMQGSLLETDDQMLADAKLGNTMPDWYFDQVVPRLLSGELNLPNGYSSISRLVAAGIDPNSYHLIDANMTIAQFFKVEGMPVETANDLIRKQLTGEVDAKYVAAFSKVGRTTPGKTEVDNARKFDKATNKARITNKDTKARGITVLDFDDTLATTKSKVLWTAPDGTTGSLNAEQYASTYQDLAAQGYKFDFSEFNKVVGGETAPLFNKALKLQDKFGSKDMFILTARPPEAQQAIYEFLQAQGLKIPLKNITGLGNSTSEAKALWMADKVADGYNDFYFADDALQNVQAVQNMLDQFDIKSKVQQAKVQFSKSINTKFNDILESTTGIESEKRFSDTQAKLRGAKGKYKGIVPPSAQDFMGLLYNFIGKGKKGDADMAFFKEALVDPFARGIDELNASRQAAANDYKNLTKQFPKIKKKLNKKVGESAFTNDQAVRVYLWNKAGFDVPGLSKRDLALLGEHIKNDPELQAFADGVGIVSKKQEGYSKPGEYWLVENIASDLMSDGAIGDARSDFLAEWKQNKDQIFSEENLNKIEAIYGSKFREALSDILYRMESGKNRPQGSGRIMNTYMNWVNNSVGAIMFFNVRSAVLQTISATNYINWTDNNPLKAAAAFANQKQYWSDFATLFNSDYLKQRRSGNRRGVNEADLSAAVAGSENKAKAALAWLLSKGFLPTQIADSFAIASGGATFYRNRVKKYIKQGMDQKKAEQQAFLDFQETTEVSQQSARPDMISQQQANPLGRLILSFQNTPMQYGRIMNKSFRDLANGRGDTKTHMSKIIYYGGIQAVIFGALQSAIFAALGDDDEEEFDSKKERILNQMVDSWLTTIGYGGKAVSTIKNTVREYLEQKDKGYQSDHAYTLIELLGFSPPIGSKIRKVYSSIQTDKFNEDVYKKRGFTLDNPIWSAIGNTVEGITNIPLGRISQKLSNLDNAMDSNNEWWQRVALVMGWNTWDLGVEDQDIKEIKGEITEEKKVASKEKAKIKKEKKQEEKQKALNETIEEEKEQQEKGELKDPKCSNVGSGGERCKNSVANAGDKCTIHEKVKENETGEEKQCKGTRTNGKQCGMMTNSKSGYCYYHD